MVAASRMEICGRQPGGVACGAGGVSNLVDGRPLVWSDPALGTGSAAAQDSADSGFDDQLVGHDGIQFRGANVVLGEEGHGAGQHGTALGIVVRPPGHQGLEFRGQPFDR